MIVDEDELAPGPILADTLQRFEITHLKTTPFALTSTDPKAGKLAIQHVINGGGACRPAVVRKWSQVASFHNAYGLTETTICNLLTDELEWKDCQEGVPLGRIVGNCDYQIDPAAVQGEDPDRGELVITGQSVALGYLRNGSLEPFGAAEGPASYRTGDVVMRRNGECYFIERLDRQVKVRGYRLDPGEIETAVCGHEGVIEAVVTIEAHSGQTEGETDALVCYYHGAADARELRNYLAGVLEPYKVPSILRQVDKMLYTANGKIDKNALSQQRTTAKTETRNAGPSAKIIDLLQGLTGVDDVTVHDNFFDIGGDSASALVLVKFLRESGWQDAGVRDILRAQTIGDLCKKLPQLEEIN